MCEGSIGDEVADVPSDLKNSNIIVMVAIVGVVDHALGRNPTACWSTMIVDHDENGELGHVC